MAQNNVRGTWSDISSAEHPPKGFWYIVQFNYFSSPIPSMEDPIKSTGQFRVREWDPLHLYIVHGRPIWNTAERRVRDGQRDWFVPCGEIGT